MHNSNLILSVVFSPDGLTLDSSSHDKTILIWNYENKNQILIGHTNDVNSVYFSPDGKTLGSGVTIEQLKFGIVKCEI